MRPAVVFSSAIHLFLCGIIASKEDLYVDPPLVTTCEYFVELKRGIPFSIECISEYPITWKPFEGFTGNYRLDHTGIAEKEYRFKSTIHLTDITHHYVGYFFCVANSSQSDYDYSHRFSAEKRYNLIGTTGLSMIYAYVNDYYNLLAPRHSKDIVILRNEYLLLPCKPTMYYTNVKLLVDGVEINARQTEKGFERGCLYDIKIGFLIKFSNIADILGKTFKCLVDSTYYSSNRNTINFKVNLHVPKIKSATGLYGIIGERLTLNCAIDILKGVNFSIKWKLPNDASLKENRYTESSKETRVSEITIKDIKDIDHGYYECEVLDHLQNKSSCDKIFIEILNKDDDHIRMNTLNGIYKQEISSSMVAAVWQVRFRADAETKLEWLNNVDRLITTNETNKYELKIVDDHIVLRIYLLEPKDSGYYTLKANNSKYSVERKFELVVKERPSVSVSKSVLVKNDEPAKFVCSCESYPLSTIAWTFTPCKPTPQWPTCDTEHVHIIEDEFIHTTAQSAWTQTSVVILNATEAGRVECKAVNSEGKSSSTTLLEIEDDDKQFYIRRLGDDGRIFVDDTVTLSCEASAFTYSHLKWYLNNVLIEDSDNITLKSWDADLTFRKSITWNQIQSTNSGSYECRAIATLMDSIETISTYRSERTENQTWYIEVHKGSKPEVDTTRLAEDDMKVMLGKGFSLFCNIIAAPDPFIKWSKNGESIEGDQRIGFSDGNKTLKIEYSIVEDDGKFKCTGENNLGIAERFFSVTITDVPKIQEKIPNWVIAVIVLVTLALIICGLLLLERYRRERRLRGQLYALGLENFKKGNPDSINPDLPMDEQADLLPFNKKFEFSKKKLTLGKVLGSGAFGVVVKGLAAGILSHEVQTTVAVKMVKGAADKVQIRALVTELKIMTHLGQHLNVVNLLGAVTKNIAKRELMVIVEYCRFGNVQSFLIKHRKAFIDQRNTATDSIDPTQKRSYEGEYVLPGQFDSSEGMDGAHADTAFIQRSPSASEEHSVVLSNDSLQPVDYVRPTRVVTTTDLVCWLFQVARGMDYLASRKVLHGDLAARNILLSDDNVVKICDFGLARSMYKSVNYIKKGEEPLPLKWLAIESISDQVFSTFSDVWSFGIVMWELFSLGRTPYPGMNANQDLYSKLKSGYRMDRPEKATQEIYDIMLHCWNAHPESRPLFNALEKRLRNLLDNEVTQHYVELNQPYVEMNANNLKQGQTDYLSLMGPPGPGGMGSPSMSDSVDNIVKASQAVPAYLSMKPIFGSDELGNKTDITDGVSNPGYVMCEQHGVAVDYHGYAARRKIVETKM